MKEKKTNDTLRERPVQPEVRTTVTVLMPIGAMGRNDLDNKINTVLREIAEKYQKEGEWAEKYGTNINNDVFMMHRYCWCEKDDCLWCSEDDDIRAPNFWYKPLDFKVWWYKYIGRGLETNKILTAEQIEVMRNKCLSCC